MRETIFLFRERIHCSTLNKISSEASNRSKGGRNEREQRASTMATLVGDGVTMLRYDPDNNFSKFKEKISRAPIEKYGNLGKLIETAEYFESPETAIWITTHMVGMHLISRS